MNITWEDYDKIAEALAAKFKDVDLVNVTDDEVIAMVKSLENFEGEDKPADADIINAIVTLWIRLDDDSGYDDSQFDAYV